MTIEDMNIKLKHLITCMKCETSGKVCDENCLTQYEAGNMGEIIENLEAISEILEQKPCEDCVSRQAILDIIMPYCQDDDGSVENTGDLRNALDDIESLSPVTPKEKIIHCKDCKYRDYWGDCNKWSKELDAHKTYLLDENMFCGLAEIKDGE